MAKRDLPSPEVLRQLLRYEPETGKLFWRERTPEHFEEKSQSAQHNCNIWNSKYAGSEALCTIKPGGHLYGTISWGGRKPKLYAHRVAWAIYHGEWPEVIDHINGDPADNRIDNLRSTTQHENAKNQKKRFTNSSGITGVRFYAPRGKWTASITHNRKDHHLGYFKTAEEAAQARAAAEARFGFSDRHGL